MEYFLACLAFFVGAHVAQRNLDAGIEECELTHAACYDVPLVVGGGKYSWIGPELLTCTAEFCLAYYLDGVEWLALLVFLLVDFAVAEHLRLHVCRECIDATYTYTVQTATDFV